MLYSGMQRCAVMSEAGGSPAQQAAHRRLSTAHVHFESDLDRWGTRGSIWSISSLTIMQAGISHLGGSPV